LRKKNIQNNPGGGGTSGIAANRLALIESLQGDINDRKSVKFYRENFAQPSSSHYVPVSEILSMDALWRFGYSDMPPSKNPYRPESAFDEDLTTYWQSDCSNVLEGLEDRKLRQPEAFSAEGSEGSSNAQSSASSSASNDWSVGGGDSEESESSGSGSSGSASSGTGSGSSGSGELNVFPAAAAFRPCVVPGQAWIGVEFVNRDDGVEKGGSRKRKRERRRKLGKGEAETGDSLDDLDGMDDGADEGTDNGADDGRDHGTEVRKERVKRTEDRVADDEELYDDKLDRAADGVIYERVVDPQGLFTGARRKGSKIEGNEKEMRAAESEGNKKEVSREVSTKGTGSTQRQLMTSTSARVKEIISKALPKTDPISMPRCVQIHQSPLARHQTSDLNFV
jgi:hypothetical protein